MDIWTQTRHGRAFSLVNPDPADVDFTEIALTLADLPRYAANFEKPVSVAQHTLIVMEAADPDDRAHALLHDLHEAYMGDIITPTARALAAVAGQLYGAGAADTVTVAIQALKARIDTAIYQAAGVALPAPDRYARIHQADMIALQTERRDFLARSPKPWDRRIESYPTLPKVQRLRRPADVADELLKNFKIYFPALRREAA